MPRAVLVANGGNLDSLPDEVQDVANAFSAAGWTVRLCIHANASRAGLQQAAKEGTAELAWFGCHSSAAGFVLDDGTLSPTELGRWLADLGACECVLNACYSLEHVTAIQRAATDVGVACAIDPLGVDDKLAWASGVAIARSYVESGDMARAVEGVRGNGYRYVPRGGRGTGERRRMPVDKNTEEQLAKLVRAVLGEPDAGYIGLVAAVGRLQGQITAMAEDQRIRAEEQRIRAEEQRVWRAEVDRKIAAIEHDMREPSPPSARVMSLMLGAFVVVAMLLLYAALRWGGV